MTKGDNSHHGSHHTERTVPDEGFFKNTKATSHKKMTVIKS